MWNRTAQLAFCAVLAGLLYACGKDAPPVGGPDASPPPATQFTVDPNVQIALPGQAGAFFLDVYQVALPFGGVSRSEDFWRRVDEERLPPHVKDLLLKNGIRAGMADSGDWDYFRGIIEQHPHVARSGSVVATGTGEVELEMRKNVLEQDIFVLTPQNEVVGRTYDYCADLFGVTFWPDPRRRGTMWLRVVPTVRSLRYRLEYTPLNEERVVREFRPETIYDINLQAAIPADRFLVLGLSELGDRRTSLGNQFLTMEGKVDRQEQVLIFVPRLTGRRAPAATQSLPLIDADRR